MISKYMVPLFALAAVFLIIAVPYTSAAGEDLLEKQVNYEIDAEYADEHDRVVNIADESAITNPDTWSPSPQGIWIGASTEESLFEFDKIMETDNVFQVHSHHRFNSTQIMNGASTTIIRSPISPDGVHTMRLRVWVIDTPDWNLREPGTPYPFLVGNHILAASVEIDMSDTSIIHGGDQWTVDSRTYVKLYGPLYSGVDYVFSWAAIYEPDCRPAIYMSSQDIANDNITDTQISIYSRQIVDQSYSKTYRWNIDPGISFDFQQGLGNGVYAQSFYMQAGDSISVLTRQGTEGSDQSYYHTVMIPWATSDGTIHAEVKAEYSSNGVNWSPLWKDSRTQWNGYILACSDEKVPQLSRPYLRVTVTMLSSERVNWIFLDSATKEFGQSNNYNHAIVTNDGVEHKVQSKLYASYQRSDGEVFMPSLNPDDFPALPAPQVNERGNYYGTIIGLALMVVGGILVATVIGAPVGFFLGGAGAVMFTADLMSGGRLFTDDGSGGFKIPGIFSDPLDTIRDALQDIGNFLISVGQAFYDGVKWLVDAVTEYLPILLGLAIVGVGLALFFYPVFYQLKLWGIALSMARGNLLAATNQAEQLKGEISGTLNKLRGR